MKKENIEKKIDEKIIILKHLIKKFNDAYKDWNNKKLNEIERKKAERIIDSMCEEDLTPSVNEIRIKDLEELKK